MGAETHFDRVAMIGLGLIGSSLGHAMKRGGLAGHVAGYARSETTRARALELGRCFLKAGLFSMRLERG